jgi:uncharacterized repeat protein (TIGR03803 family)
VPFRPKNPVPCLEVRINERVQVARYIVLKAADECELPELQSGIDFDSTGRESHSQRLQPSCRVRNECDVTICFAAPRRRPIPGCANRLSPRGPSSPCHHRSENGCGTVFKITPSGKLTTLYSFCTQTNCSDGLAPGAGLVQATDGNFYGTTVLGGANSVCPNSNGCGTVFKNTPAGELTLHVFDGTDGQYPVAGLLQATDGNFYGTTNEGGADSVGTVFSISMGFGPFVRFMRSSGKVEWKVEILGQGFTGTTGVSFDGTAANFLVHSDTYLTATVPQGATTGFVTVTTPGGRLQSNVVFRVTP